MFRLLVSLLVAAAVPAAAFAQRGQSIHPLEPVAIPPSIEQGIDLIYIDPEIAPSVRDRDKLLQEIGLDGGLGAPIDLIAPVSPIYTDLRRGLVRYRKAWSGLPQVQIPAGPVLKPGAKGERVALLRERLGLAPSGGYGADLAAAVKRYQQAHGMKADGIAGAATISSLNLGAEHHEQLIMLNMERAKRLPGSAEKGRYILIDAGAARLFMYEDGKLVDSMKAIVGKAASPTPMMAALVRHATVNPYWNVPADLAQTLVAPKVLAEGLKHLKDERYEVLSGWTVDAEPIDPTTVDWEAVAARKLEPRIRQLPGYKNSMGDIKFMMPNDYGIYLHDTPDKALFQKEERWISNGCVRVEDAHRLARWLFGEMPKGKDANAEEDVKLDQPVPVYITYMTAASTPDGVVFRKDPYGRDAPLLARFFAPKPELALSSN